MFSNHMLGLLYDAPKEWREIGQEPSETISQVYLRHALLLALIPPFALYLGSTQMGWSTAAGELVYLASDSAAVMAVAAPQRNFRRTSGPTLGSSPPATPGSLGSPSPTR